MKKRIFRSICITALASLLLMSFCVVLLLYKKTTQYGWSSLETNAASIAAGYETGGTEYLAQIKGYHGRITLIAADGTVVFDDRSSHDDMENHAQRPEVLAAASEGSGKAKRQSSTLGENTLYYAQRLSDGSILRLSVNTANMGAEALRFLPLLLVVSAVLILAAAFAAKKQTQSIVAPVNSIDLDNPYKSEIYEELSPLVRRMQTQKGQIASQMEAMEKSRQEFITITESMSEGLIVTDSKANVLTINKSAQHILGAHGVQGAGMPLVEVSRNLVLENAAKKASEGLRTEAAITIDARYYRIVATPTATAGGGQGVVILLMDDTERQQAEETRREFTANVSHELKTPLTSISGYAEIIKGGIVQPEDIKDFAGKIYDEAGRLIVLIQDIIQLSRLDEKQFETEQSEIELLSLARQVTGALERAAEAKRVNVQVYGRPVLVPGVRAILEEIIYNLTENAIRYNKDGGSVDVTVGEKGGEAFIQVEDTGLGIADEYKPHVFERFYRVEKSHSRQSGGTGLGLSIVKRGAISQGGRVELESEQGEGSTFTVWLPL